MGKEYGANSLDIIYFCRDALASGRNISNKKEAEAEILELIKSKDWNWYARDIDNNIILTYPVFNNAFKVVRFLLEENKYNLNQYNPTLSKALSACINLHGKGMLDLILGFNVDNKYKTDMVIKAYNLASAVKEESYRDTYINLVNDLLKDSDFIEVIDGIVNSSSVDCFHHFLFNHPLEHDRKVQITKQIADNYTNFGVSSTDLSSKNRVLEKFEVFAELQSLNKNTTKVKRAKI